MSSNPDLIAVDLVTEPDFESREPWAVEAMAQVICRALAVQIDGEQRPFRATANVGEVLRAPAWVVPGMGVRAHFLVEVLGEPAFDGPPSPRRAERKLLGARLSPPRKAGYAILGANEEREFSIERFEGVCQLRDLVLESTCDAAIEIVDLRCGTRSQLVSGDPLPFTAFSSKGKDSERPTFDFDAVQSGQTLSVSLRNRAHFPVRVRGSFLLRRLLGPRPVGLEQVADPASR